MLKMRPFSITLLGLIACSILVPTRAIGQASCEKRDITPALARSFADTLARRTNKALAATSAEIHVASVPVRLPQGCVNVVALSWSDAFEGGVVIHSIDNGKSVIQGVLDYPGAQSPMPAGTGRVVFTYSAGRGSGQVAERTAVLCSLANDIWVVCADMLTRQEVAATGYPPSDSLAKGVGLSMRSRISVIRDTLVVTSDVAITRYGAHSPIHRTLIARHPLP